MKEKIRIAVSGAGSRARGVVKNLLRDSGGNVEIVSVFEPDQAVAREALGKDIWNSPSTKLCGSWAEALACPGVEWAMIFSPNYCHKGQILEAFAAGKKVFSEKPLATTIEDCQAIYDAQRKSGLTFATGFVLRYSSLYRKAHEMLASGMFGKLIMIEGNENVRPEHGGYIMCNWRRLSKFAGPHILEKCCHDLDLIEWFVGSLPSRVAAFQGRDFFLPANNGLLKKYGAETFMKWWDPHRTQTPFTDDSDLMDNLISVAEFRNGVRVSFNCSMSNAIPERRMSFCCSEGTLKLELYHSRIEWRTLSDEAVHSLDFSG